MKKTISKLGLIAVLTTFIVTFCNCGLLQAAEEEFHETYTLKAGETVSVQSINGSIEVRTWNKDFVDVFAVKKTNRRRSELDKVEIVISTHGGLVIETDHLTKNPKVSVSYTIKIPKNINLEEARSTNGSINIDGASGDAVLRTTNGKIRVKNADGIIDAHTTNGAISIENTKGIRSAKTTNGRLDIEISELPENDVEIRTTNGSIDFNIPDDLDADLEVNTTNGKIYLNGIRLLANEISKNKIHGQLGNGGRKMIMRTTNGSISINKL